MSTQPAPQPEGVIIPPPDIKTAISKTVDFTKRKGMDFVNRLRREKSDDPRFTFLNPDDPYHAYYLWYTKEVDEGRVQVSGSNAVSSKSNGAAQAQDKVEPPIELEFAFTLPSVSALDMDIIKTTALYVAHNGEKFLTDLSHREADNYQFEFLRRGHSLHPLFMNMVEQYKRTLKLATDAKLQEKIQQGVDTPYQVFVRAKGRAEYEAKVADEEKRRQDQEKKEREEFAQVDWDDFVVVQTIDFTQEDYEVDLPAPLTLSQVQHASLEQKKKGIMLIEEAEPDYVPQPQRQEAPAPQSQPQPQPQPARPSPSASPSSSSAQQAQGQSQNGIKIRPKGTSRRTQMRQTAQTMFISPLNGKPVPESEYNEHMRISQLDPNARKIKDKVAQREATTNLNEAGAAENLKRLHEEEDSNGQSKQRRREFGPQR